MITQIIDASCFIRLVWNDGTEEDLNKDDFKLSIVDSFVSVGDQSGYFQLIKFSDITSPVTANNQALYSAILAFANSNPCSGGGGGVGDVVGPAGATDSNFALYDGVTGKLIKDSGINAASFDAAGAAAAVAALLPTYALVANDATTASNVLADVPGLVINCPKNHTYEFEAELTIGADAITGILFAVNHSGAATLQAGAFGTRVAGTCNAEAVTALSTSGAPYLAIAGSSVGIWLVKGIITPTGNGDISIQWKAGIAATVEVFKNSYLKLTLIS